MLLRTIPAALLLCCLAGCTLKVGDLGELTDSGSGDPSSSPGTDPATDPGVETDAPSDSSSGDTEETGVLAPVIGVDILFVIDNSGSMSDHQQRLGQALPALAGPLTAAGLDLRIAVTTTDAGNPRCPAATYKPENGGFQTRSCREGVAAGEWLFNQDDFTSACTDICSHETITLSPTATVEDPTPAVRPWIESSAGGGNIDIPLDEALACVLPQGVAGCGFESPLEAMYLALARTQDPASPEFGFLRADADLLVVIVTDESDCSGNPEFKEIFTSNKIFWNNAADSAPTSAMCWRAGMRCDGGPGTYSDCVAVDRDVTADETQDPSDAVLQPLTRYQGVLSTILAGKTAAGSSGKVHVAAITGVPVGYPQNPLVFADSPVPEDQLNFGIAPGCEVDGVKAMPPGRIREVVSQTAPLGPGLFSICDDSFDASLSALASGLLED